MKFSVTCGEFGADEDDDEGEWTVEGFHSQAAAQEYARRFIRSQIEDMRQDCDDDPAVLKQTYLTWGEYALADGFDAVSWVEYCIGTPAMRRSETDYESLDPNL